MKNLRVFSNACALAATLAGLLAAVPAQAGPQWKWRDANGVMQYTDRPPPAGTPDSQILSRPAQLNRVPKPAEAAASDAQAPTASKAAKAADPELEARRRKAEEKKAEEKKVEEEKQAKVRAENCDRARSYDRSLKDGMRIARTNANGEREVLDDQARADEIQRTQEAIQSNCK